MALAYSPPGYFSSRQQGPWFHRVADIYQWHVRCSGWPAVRTGASTRLLLAAVIAIALGLRPASAAPGGGEGAEFRRFMHDLVDASGSAPDQQVGQLKAVFRKHPDSRRWLVEGD